MSVRIDLRVCRWRAGYVLLLLTILLSFAGREVRAENRALFIALDTYQNPALNLPPNSSVLDAQGLRDLAVTHLGFTRDQTMVLANEQATKEGILHAIREWLVEGSQPGDKVMFTYSGHGTRTQDLSGDEGDGKDEALVPWDMGNRAEGLLLDDELQLAFAELAGRDLLAIIDSCNSGTVTRGNEDITALSRSAPSLEISGTRAFTRVPESPNQQENVGTYVADRPDGSVRVFSAVASHEVALVDSEATPKQGVFTRRLIEGVSTGAADGNRNGVISNAELLFYLRRESERYCSGNPYCRSLSPTFDGSDDVLSRDFRTGNRAPVTQGGAVDGLGAQPTASLNLSIAPSTNLRLGQKVTFGVRSSIDGYLLILDVNANGELMQLFPNAFSDAAGKGNQINRGQTIAIPDVTYGMEFEVGEPVGQGQVLALISTERIGYGDVVTANRNLGSVADPARYVEQLSKVLMSSWSKTSQGRPVDWGMTTLSYTISY